MGLAAFEKNLPNNLESLHKKVNEGGWFDGVNPGRVWITPKKLQSPKSTKSTNVIRIGSPELEKNNCLQVQVRLEPDPEFAILEVLYLWEFGPALDQLLSPQSIGYRLDLKNGRIDRKRRWLFEYWPKRYQEFRRIPLDAARESLDSESGEIALISADFASFYDTIDPAFLVSESFMGSLQQPQALGRPANGVDVARYKEATQSLLRAYKRFRSLARRIGVPMDIGLPIGALTSRVVANLALEPLDRHIQSNENVACYRRYVDDFVVVSKSAERIDTNNLLSRYVPFEGENSEGLRVDSAALERGGSMLQLQPEKLRVHVLRGVAGRDFLESVANDFQRLVSERRAFLDPDVLTAGAVHALVRMTSREGSRLRTLREADRVRLERFSLSTSLRSLERVSSMLDAHYAREVVSKNIEGLSRVLSGEGDWVEALDVSVRIMRLAARTGDWGSLRTQIDEMDDLWGSEESIRQAVHQLRYRDIQIEDERAWDRLVAYLLARRLEAICAVVPLNASPASMREAFPRGLLTHRGRKGVVALSNGGKLLAAADLRMFDREDDRSFQFLPSDPPRWLEDILSGHRSLIRRFRTIRKFVKVCERLGDQPWRGAPARLFLCTRPPSYFDISRRWLYGAGSKGFEPDVFEKLLAVVNAIRGTEYKDPIAQVVDRDTVRIPIGTSGVAGAIANDPDPRLILGNLVLPDSYWSGAATRVVGSDVGAPVLSPGRLGDLICLLARAEEATIDRTRVKRSSLLVLPELSLPRAWFRDVANYVARSGGFGLVCGLEYLHSAKDPQVFNQVYAVIPGPMCSVATWPWTKAIPAREEAALLASMPSPVQYPAAKAFSRRTVVHSPWGRLSVLICSEMIEARRVADLLGRADLIISPSWNTDTASYDHLIQSVAFQLHAFVAIANNGHYSDCRAWAPRSIRWQRDLCRLIERDRNNVVAVNLPMSSLMSFHKSVAPPVKVVKKNASLEGEWRPLPPDWPYE